jgi:hypothetical protein
LCNGLRLLNRCTRYLDFGGIRGETVCQSRTGRRRGVMPRRRHVAARRERRGKERGGEDVRWRAYMAVWGAK